MKFLRRRFFPPPALLSSLITLARYSRPVSIAILQRNPFNVIVLTSPRASIERFSRIYDSSLSFFFFFFFFSSSFSRHLCMQYSRISTNKVDCVQVFFFFILKGIYFCRRRERDDDNVAQVLERPLSKWGGRQVEAERREIDCLNGRKRRERGKVER